MSLPSDLVLPKEFRLGSLDDSLPRECRTWVSKVQPINYSSVTSPTCTAPAVTGTYGGNYVGTILPITFEIPCSQSPSTFLDNRMTTLNFTARYTGITAGTAASNASGYLRSGALSYFDRMQILGQNGVPLEDNSELGLTSDTINFSQMSASDLVGLSLTEGFHASGQVSGHAISIFAGRPLVATDSVSYSYSIPLPSAIIGTLNDSFLNIGRTRRMTLTLYTASVLPITILAGTVTTAPGTFSVTLENFSIGLRYIDIGPQALMDLDRTLVGSNAYMHSTMFKTATTQLPATSGTVTLPLGLSAMSVKSLFARFVDGTAADTDNSVNGKYDSKNPVLQGINWVIGGQNVPQVQVNPLLESAQCYKDLQQAVGAFNNTSMHSAITPTLFCKLSQGGTASTELVGTTQNRFWSLGSVAANCCRFIFATDCEFVPKKGLLSGLDISKQPVALSLNIKSTLTSAHTVYAIALVDAIIEHNVLTGDIIVKG